MSASKSRRARHQIIEAPKRPDADSAMGYGDYEAASDATPELFVTSTTPHDDFEPEQSSWDETAYSVLDDEDEELEALNTEVVRDWARFDDDARWRETARTGRAL